MRDIYFLIILVLTAVGSVYVGLHAKQMVARYKKYRRKLARKSLKARIEQLEMRVDLHTRKDGTYLNKFDELEEMINNVTKSSRQKEQNRDRKVKKIVLNYLEELRNGKQNL